MAFELDEAFLLGGGIQHFFGLANPDGTSAGGTPPGAADQTGSALKSLRVLDQDGLWRTMHEEKLHAMITRVAYVADVPVQFFNEARVRNADFINAVMPGMNVAQNPDGSYFAKGSVFCFIPSTRFTLDYRRGASATRLPTTLLQGLRSDRNTQVLLLQRNSEFGRIGGIRTSRASYAATAHYAIAPGRTLIVNCTLGYLHGLPPLNGARFIREKATEYTGEMIARIKAHGSGSHALLQQ